MSVPAQVRSGSKRVNLQAAGVAVAVYMHWQQHHTVEPMRGIIRPADLEAVKLELMRFVDDTPAGIDEAELTTIMSQLA